MSQNVWSKADFLDRAQELKRRLEVWHIDGNEPIYSPKDIVEFLKAERQVFRDRVMLEPFDPNRRFKTWNLAGSSFIEIPIDRCAKHITTWEFRDFVEHLVDAGDSDEAKLVRLKVERLLDSPMNVRASHPIFGEYIKGREIEKTLITEFFDAIIVFANAADQPDATGSKPEKTLTASAPVEQAEIWVAIPTITKIVGFDRSRLAQWVSGIPGTMKRKQGKSWEVKFPDANAHWPSTWKKIDLEDC
jgi:hypothetical protein